MRETGVAEWLEIYHFVRGSWARPINPEPRASHPVAVNDHDHVDDHDGPARRRGPIVPEK